MNETLDVSRFGAVGDGITLDTDALQKTLDENAERGGGTVHLPPGTYLTGTLHVPSRTTLDLHPSARLLGSPDLQHYHTGEWGHNQDRTPWHLLLLEGSDEVTLCGGGTIDGNGPAFWEDTVAGPHADARTQIPPGAHGGIDAITAVAARHADSPDRSPIAWIRANKEARPSPLIEATGCRNLRILDVTLTNSAGWTLHLHNCRMVWLRGVKVVNNLMGPNNDGFDITGCHDVMVSDCHISTCDDAIVLKTTPDSDTIERITVTNCILRTPCVALKFGTTESYQDFRNVTFSNCVVYESTRAIGLYTKNGGNIDNVAISNIVADTRVAFAMNRPIHLQAETPADGTTAAGRIRNVHISGVVMETDGRVLITADEPGQIEDLVLRDIQMKLPAFDNPTLLEGMVSVGQFPAKHTDIAYSKGVVMAKNVKRLVLENLLVTWPEQDDHGSFVVPEPWNFPIKACNGQFDEFFPRERFAEKGCCDIPLVVAIGVRGGSIDVSLSEPLGGAQPVISRDSEIRIRDGA